MVLGGCIPNEKEGIPFQRWIFMAVHTGSGTRKELALQRQMTPVLLFQEVLTTVPRQSPRRRIYARFAVEAPKTRAAEDKRAAKSAAISNHTPAVSSRFQRTNCSTRGSIALQNQVNHLNCPCFLRLGVRLRWPLGRPVLQRGGVPPFQMGTFSTEPLGCGSAVAADP